MDVVGAVSLVISLPGVSGSKAQMLLMVQSGSNYPRGNVVFAEVCSLHGCALVSMSVEVIASGLLQQRSLAQVCSYRGLCLRHALAKVTGSILHPQKSLTHIWSHRGFCLGPATLAVAP